MARTVIPPSQLSSIPSNHNNNNNRKRILIRTSEIDGMASRERERERGRSVSRAAFSFLLLRRPPFLSLLFLFFPSIFFSLSLSFVSLSLPFKASTSLHSRQTAAPDYRSLFYSLRPYIMSTAHPDAPRLIHHSPSALSSSSAPAGRSVSAF